MHSLTIVFGQRHSVVWTMTFQDGEKAETARIALVDKTINDNIDITDDFGQRVNMNGGDIVAVMLEDLSLSKLAHVERAIHHAHIQSDAQQRAESDPKLRIARSMQGPSMFSPMNGRM